MDLPPPPSPTEPLPHLPGSDFLALLDPSTHDKVREKILEPGVEGMFAMQSAELHDGPGAGHWYAVQYGPDRTFKADDLYLGRLVGNPTGGSRMYAMRCHTRRSEFTQRWDATNPPKSAMPKDHSVATENLSEIDFPPNGGTPVLLSDEELRKEWPTLYKKTTGGKTQEWEIWVEKTPEGHGRIHTKYGLQDGKKQEQTDTVEKGKNLGKKNATTAYQQACLEAEAEWTKQLERKGYGRDVEASAGVRGQSPMLAQDYKKVKPAEIQWGYAFAQPKLDGFRCLADLKDGVVTLRSRENKPILTMPHVVEALTAMFRARNIKDGWTLDGELYLHGVPFQKLASWVKKHQPASLVVEYHVYDLMDPDPFEARFTEIVKLIGDLVGPVRLVGTLRVSGPGALNTFQAECLAGGYEGAMLRHGMTEGYEAGKRSKLLLKVKTFTDGEFEVVSVREGRGTHKDMAIFVCATEAGTRFEVTAPGGHDEKKKFWEDRDECIGKMLTVKFQEYTTGNDPVPRFPVALRFRDD